MTPPVLAIVWDSRTGAAQAMAKAAAHGAMASVCEDGDSTSAVQVVLVRASAVTPQLLLAAAGYLFVCPEYLGTMSGIMKDMFDRVYYPLLGQVEGRPYSTIIAAGSDGAGAQAQIQRIVTGWRLRQVAKPLVICVNAQTPQAILAAKTVPANDLARCHELGATLMSGLALGVF